MILIVGAQASGKREYAKSLGYSEDDMADACIDRKPVLYNLQEIVRDNPNLDARLLDSLLSKEVVICNEVGGGVVPIDESDIRFRESVGRLCASLAVKADKVVRVVCGLPVVLKG